MMTYLYWIAATLLLYGVAAGHAKDQGLSGIPQEFRGQWCGVNDSAFDFKKSNNGTCKNDYLEVDRLSFFILKVHCWQEGSHLYLRGTTLFSEDLACARHDPNGELKRGSGSIKWTLLKGGNTMRVKWDFHFADEAD